MDWRDNPNWLDLRDRYGISETQIERVVADFLQLDLRRSVERFSPTERLFWEQGKDAGVIAAHVAEVYGLTKKQAKPVWTIFNARAATQEAVRRQLALGVRQGIWRCTMAGRNPCSHRDLDGKTFDIRKGMPFDGRMILPGEDAGCMCMHSPVIAGFDESPTLLQRLRRMFSRS
ncbi:hypothetical protein [Pseudomonas panipatensis]|uniref:hypothetical protein n=1 Tax=Pseudomonas panipatensis TaxID=428992 RepID=UPI0035AE9C5C